MSPLVWSTIFMASALLFSFVVVVHSQNLYVVDNYTEYAFPFTGTNAASTQSIQLAFALGLCTKTGSHTSATSAQPGLFQCTGSGSTIAGPCSVPLTSIDSCLDLTFDCTLSWPEVAFQSVNAATRCPDGASTTSSNYMEVSFYCGYTDESRPGSCPGDESVFLEHGLTRLVTDVCVDQGNGDFFMASCNNVTGEIGVYDDAACGNRVSSYREYERTCNIYAYPDDNQPCRFFHRITGCVVNGSNTLADTMEPTNDPSASPSLYPSSSPSLFPTQVPSNSPSDVTQAPSSQPSSAPSKAPTMEPSMSPSIAPSKPPTNTRTDAPSVPPSAFAAPEQTVAGAILSDLDNLSMMYIVCGILFVFYLFICCYIWMNERRKRRTLKSKFQKEEDKEARIAYLRKKNEERRLELQARQADYDAFGNNNYHQMEAHVGNNKQALSPQEQFLQEGM